MIKRMLFVGDYYRGNQERNIEIIFGLLSPFFVPVLECEMLRYGEVYTDNEKYIQTLDGIGESILSQLDLTDSCIIGFEINPIDLKYLNIHNIPWINFEIHPIRFLDDLYFNITSSIDFDFSTLAIPESEIQLLANTLKLEQRISFTYNKNNLLIVGQTPIDKSVYFDSKFKTLKDYDEKIEDIVKNYSQIYYRPHPNLSNPEVDQWVIEKFGAVVLLDESYYKLLSSNMFSSVCGISSSSLFEAKYFSKNVIFLEDRKKLYASPISLNNFIAKMDDWTGYFLGIKLNGSKHKLPANTLRNMYEYWSYETPINTIRSRVGVIELCQNKIEMLAIQAERNASEANERATQAEQNANEANARATQAEQHIELLLNSNSWKITKPLRLLSGFVGYFLRGVYSWISFAPGSRPRRVSVKLINLVKNKNKYTEKEIYGCVITKNKPSILVDMYVLGQGVKTGVYRVCDEIYKRLVISKEFNIIYYVNGNFAEESKRYIKDSKYPCFDKSYNYNDVKNKIDFFLAPFGVAPAEIISNDNIKHIHIIYDLIAIHNPEYFSVEGALEVKKIIDSLSDKTIIFAISENTKKDLLKYRSDFNEEQITVIPLAADSKFCPCLDENIKKSVHTKYNIPENPYILSLATLEVRKNMDKVVESFSAFIQNNPQSRHNLVLSGMIGWKLEKLQNKLKEKKELLGRVILTGFVDDIDLPALYSGADCFVYLSKYEGFGLPPLEAMACGTPVITSNNSSLPEVIGDAGLMFDCDDINSIANAMKKITSDPCYRDKLSKKGLIQAKKFNWDTAVSIILERLKKEFYNG